jgi:hypothetical protein
MRIIFLILFLLSGLASAQQQCICTAGCKIASDPYPPGIGQPTTCSVKIGGVVVASASVVASSTIPLSNASVCLPASGTYNPGVTGSVACQVPIAAQANGSTVTVIMNASNAAGLSVDSAAFSFQSVSALATVPQVPMNLRPN